MTLRCQIATTFDKFLGRSRNESGGIMGGGELKLAPTVPDKIAGKRGIVTETKLILIEGIPGSGKSTIAQKTGEYLSTRGIKTKVYTEGELHPVDLAWCAYIPFEHFESIMSLYPQYRDALRGKMRVENKHAIIAYTQLGIKDPDFIKLLESYEIFNGRVGFEDFTEIFLKRWENFAGKAEKSDEINIFECAYLQNQLCELNYFFQMDKSSIEKYMLSLIDAAKNLNPVMFYLNQADISGHIRRLGEDRVNEKGEKDWLRQMILYTENSPYARKHNLKGFEGVIKGFEKRKQIELNLIKKLPITTHIIENPDYNWEEVWKQIREKLDTILQ